MTCRDMNGKFIHLGDTVRWERQDGLYNVLGMSRLLGLVRLSGSGWVDSGELTVEPFITAVRKAIKRKEKTNAHARKED